jgi:hypothetical protein
LPSFAKATKTCSVSNRLNKLSAGGANLSASHSAPPGLKFWSRASKEHCTLLLN